MANIILSNEIARDAYVEYVRDAYDLNIEERNSVEIPMHLYPDSMSDWNIGLICGASGSGKSQIIKHLGGGMEAHFDNTKSVISNFECMEPNEAAKLLCAVGLSSVPTWVRPFKVLSNGEQYRASLAWLLAHAKEGETIRVDEYTSVVDRNVAKSMSYALQKYVRARGLKVILAACHYDIIEWLAPDWVYDLNKGGVLERGDRLRRERPTIPLRLYRTEPDTWRIFKKHHYMSEDLNESASCFVATWEDKPVAFCAVLPMPSGTLANAVRGSRTVVLPDYQGVGIGGRMTDTLAGAYANAGYSYYTKTVNPALGLHRERSPYWEGTGYNGKLRTHGLEDMMKHFGRVSYCHKYIGPKISGYENLIGPIDKIRREKSLEGQLSLF